MHLELDADVVGQDRTCSRFRVNRFVVLDSSGERRESDKVGTLSSALPSVRGSPFHTDLLRRARDGRMVMMEKDE